MSRTYSTHKTGIIPDKGLIIITITVLPLQYVGTITVLTVWYCTYNLQTKACTCISSPSFSIIMIGLIDSALFRIQSLMRFTFTVIVRTTISAPSRPNVTNTTNTTSGHQYRGAIQFKEPLCNADTDTVDDTAP